MLMTFRRLSLCCMFAVFLLSFGCRSDKELVSGLTETDANEVLVVLNSQEISAQKVQVPGRTVTFTVTVSSADFQQALKILVDNQLPKSQSAGFAQVYPAGGGGLIPTRSEEKARFVMALQGEIENMIKILPGVVNARVVLVQPDTDAIREVGAPPPRATASVAIVYNPIQRHNKPALTPQEVKELVASAVEDLEASDVSVVLTVNRPGSIIDSENQVNPALGTTFEGATKNQGALSADVLKAPSNGNDGPSPAEIQQLQDELGVLKTDIGAQSKKSRYMVWGFAALAFLGILLGIFGLVRSFILRSKLLNTQKELEAAKAAPALSQDAAEPSQQEPAA